MRRPRREDCRQRDNDRSGRSRPAVTEANYQRGSGFSAVCASSDVAPSTAHVTPRPNRRLSARLLLPRTSDIDLPSSRQFGDRRLTVSAGQGPRTGRIGPAGALELCLNLRLKVLSVAGLRDAHRATLGSRQRWIGRRGPVTDREISAVFRVWRLAGSRKLRSPAPVDWRQRYRPV